MLFKNSMQKWFGLAAAMLALLALMAASMVYGYTETSWKTVMEAFTHFNGSNEHIVIESVRLPRSMIAAAVGASLAVAGVLIQTLTKNPLASPDILGINAGAGAAVVIAVSFAGAASMQLFTWISFLGAAFAAITVYVIGSLGREGLTPMKLTLAGAAMAAMFASITQGILVFSEALLEEVLFWLAGSVAGRKLENLTAVFPYLAVGWLASLLLASKLNVLAMGEDVAKGLGVNTGLLKAGTGIVIILLSGGAVAVAGPIGFIGIIIPHLARFIAGTDHRWNIPFSALLGGILLVAADIVSRYILMPREVPVGVLTALIGTPFFICIARKGFNKR
ncbi:FecCD family ABC transporter permease [Bacillus massilinigeriensis]|uniref:FecCD family ABC transporter permease n=1 Tax=Bacillus mediterraneensis TaxID=1805474 RepID=UPI0008F94E29|nr:iron ABC transporter permease [Bacillus mediterraneensis]